MSADVIIAILITALLGLFRALAIHVINTLKFSDTRLYLSSHKHRHTFILNFQEKQLLQKPTPTLELNFHFKYNTLKSKFELKNKLIVMTITFTSHRTKNAILAHGFPYLTKSQLHYHCFNFVVLNLRYHKHTHIPKLPRKSVIATKVNSNLRTELRLQTQH